MSPLSLAFVADVVVKASLVLGLAALAAAALGRASAATRHLVWTLGVAAALLVPALRGIAPRWELPLLPATPTVVRIESAATRVTPPLGQMRKAAAAGDAAIAAGNPAPRARAAAPGLDPAWLLAVVWLVGAALVGAPLLVGTLRVSAHGRRRGVFSSPDWAALLRDIQGSLSLRRAVRLLRGRPQSMPMAWGLLRPAVVLPEDAESWPVEQRRAVLTHELGHVKRHDCLTQALAQAACAVYWFHPLAWVAAWRLRVERERACDDLVLGAGASGPDYADHLLQLARAARASAGPGWALAMARPSQLEGRLLAILDPTLDRSGPTRVAARMTVAGAAVLTLVLAGLEPWQRPVAASTSLAFETLGADGLASPPRPEAEAALVEGAAGGTLQASPSPSSERKPRREAVVSDSVVAALAEAVRDTDPEVRRQAVHSLGEMRAEGASAALAGALADQDGDVRAQAAFALGEMKTSAAVEALGKALTSDTEAEVRRQAAFALGQIRSEAAVPSLTAALADKDADVREQAAFALGELRSEEAIGPLSRALKDSEPDVRKQAAFALSEIRSPQAVPALLEALKDASPDVREQAAFALGEIGDERANDALMAALKDGTAAVRRQAAFALGQLAGEDGEGSPNLNLNLNLNVNPNPNPNPNPRPRP